MDKPQNDLIHSRACPRCPLCDAAGKQLYQGLRDGLFGVPGSWGMRQCENIDCSLVWLDPMPLEEEIGKAYRNYYTHSTEEKKKRGPVVSGKRQPHKIVDGGYLALKYGYQRTKLPLKDKLLGLAMYLHPGKRADLDFSVMYIPACRDGHLLDLGFGSGEALLRMLELGWDVEGVDFDPEVVAHAQSMGLKASQGLLCDQQYPDNYFDAIIMSHVVEHVFNPLETLKEAFRILKSGGTLVVTTPNINSLGHKLYKRSWRGLEPPRHIQLYSIKALRSQLRKSGFSTVDAESTIRDAHGMLIASRSLRRTGSFSMAGGKRSKSLRHWGRAMQWLEWFLLKWGWEVGEEIKLVAIK